MSEHAFRRIYSGFRNLEGGVDSGLAPSLIEPNQAAWMVNVTVRGGKPRTRPGFIKRLLTFQAGYDQPDFATGVWQCAIAYLSDSGVGALLAAVGGRLYRIDVEQNYEVTDVSPVGAHNPANLNCGWMVQAECYVVFQDGQSTPIIFNGAGSRYADPDEIKTGTVMAYQNGRIWYAAGTTGLAFRATDQVGNPESGTADNRYRDSVLKETENDLLLTGGDFAVPSSSGPIRAMIAPSQLDTSLGQGPLQVFTTNAVFSVNAPADRTVWKEVTFPIQTFSQIEKGALAPRFITAVNGDIWYRSDDGIRSFIVARRDFNEWGNTPQSEEMGRVLDYDNQVLLPYGSSVLFDNRLISTATPGKSSNGSVYHSQLVILDFDLVSRMRRKLPPAWEGVWIGLNKVLQVVKGRFGGVERCFAFCLNDDEEIELWEITRTGTEDRPDALTKVRIASYLETRALDFQNDNALKQLETAGLFVNNLQGQVDFDLKYKPDDHPCWVNWHSFIECGTIEQCLVNDSTCKTLKNYKPQYRPKLRLPLPADDCDSVTGKLYRNFFTVQLRIAWTGQVTINRLLTVAIDLPEKPTGECLGTATCQALDCCNPAETYDSHG